MTPSVSAPRFPVHVVPASRRRFPLILAVLLVALAPTGLEAATIRGRVLDPDGRPVPDARVLVVRPPAVVTTAATDRSGEFEVASLPAGSYEIHATAPGLVADPVSLTVAGDGEHRVELALRLSAVTESVVVSAGQADLLQSRTPASVTVIGTTDLRRAQLESVGEALATVPGMHLVQSGGRGSIGSLFPRGGESDFTLVVADGMRLNAFGGGFDFGHVAVADVERIEVVRGPQSAAFGADAIGGVVQIVTRHGGTPRFDAAIEGGSFGTIRTWAGAAGAHRSWQWGAAGERLDTDGFTGRAPGTGEPVTNDDYQSRSGSFSFGWARAATDVRGRMRLSRSERGVPGPFGSDPGGTFEGVDRISRYGLDSTVASVSVAHAWSDRIRQRAQFSAGDADAEFVSPFGVSRTETRRRTFVSQIQARLARGLDLSAGIEAQTERAGSTFITGSSFDPIPVDRRALGTFVEVRYEPASRLLVAMGARVDHFRRSELAGNPSPFAPRPPFGPDSTLSANPRVAASWMAVPPEGRSSRWTRVRASWGTGIRPPDAFEVAFTDNPALEPERNRSLDAGVEQAFAGGAVIVDATAFHNRYDDLIVAVGGRLQGASRFRTDNISNARTRGVELAVSARPTRGLDAKASYTWLDTEILAADGGRFAPAPFAVGDPLLRRPAHQGSVEVRYASGRFAGFTRVRVRGETAEIDPSFGAFGGRFTAPGFAVVTVGASAQAPWGVELFGRVANLFDRAHEEALGFPALGRSVTLGVRIAGSR